ncbi:MAG: hypothetical protein KAJ24_02135 [Candidatus Aenigmarchaeota archaeon]|nr:hypothetical protein [Candidatus Aenigmarchaeota archaeon]
MEQTPLILAVAESYPELNDILISGDNTFNPHTIKVATMYVFGKKSSDASKFGIPDDTATDLYSQLEKFERVQVGTVLKAIELETIENITDYEPQLQEELCKAIRELRNVEATYRIWLHEFNDY